MRKRGVLFVLALFLFSVFISSCGTSYTYDEREAKINKELEKGKQYLYEGSYAEAKAVFQDIIENIDFSNSQANYGYVLATYLGFADMIRTLGSLTGSLSSMAEDENIFIRDLIHDLLFDLYSKFEDIDKHLLYVMGDPTVTFYLEDHVYVYLTSATTPTLDLKGEWDRADALLLDAIAQGVMGILNFALSIDLRADYLGAYDMLNEIGMDNLSVSNIMKLLVYLLDNPTYPNFLGLDPDGGKERWEESGLNLAKAIMYTRFAFYLSSIEVDNQDDDILAFYPALTNGEKCTEQDIKENKPYCSLQWREALKNIDVCSLPATTVTGITEINIIMGPNGEKEPMEMANQAGTACLLQKFQESLDYTDDTDPKIYLVSDILPLIVGAVKDQLPESIQNLLPDDPDALKGVLVGLLGDPIAFDFGNFFKTAPEHGLRDLFPAWDDLGFILEKECPNDVPGGADNPYYLRALTDATSDMSLAEILLPCDNPDDYAHFSYSYPNFPTIHEIPNDGLASKSIYTAFQDPTFNGMLYLDFSEGHRLSNINAMWDTLPNKDLLGTTLMEANQYSLNFLIQAYMDAYGELLSGFNQ